MASPPEIQRIYDLRARGYDAEAAVPALWEELLNTPGWKLFTCMRLRRKADEAREIAAGYYREADRLTDEWEAGLR